MFTPTNYTSQSFLRSSVSWPPLGSNFGETWREQELSSLLSRELSPNLLCAVHSPGLKFTPSSCCRPSLYHLRAVASYPHCPEVSESPRISQFRVPSSPPAPSLLRPSSSLGTTVWGEDY